ncbi:hypothetical protein CMI37_17015 [Candidatus Pacearchaeota archaeon]|nr:hypothetical protein [Candidatus Pacearchaeota archaeon]|tara:strand:- start:3934 stop:4788 length:855 start_codon:yes stop_codon:yes gene_type:complete
MSEKVNKIVTDKIIELLEQGEIPWQKPWNCKSGRPKSGATGKFYRGINALICSVSGFRDPNWYTRNQLSKLDLELKECQQRKYTPIVFWNWVEKKKKEGGTERVPFTRFYKCFNRQQVRGAEELWPQVDTKPNEDWELEAEAIVQKYQNENGPKVSFGMEQASYIPGYDMITMPSRADHVSAAEYWSTYFHEITHSTGAKNRLDRAEGMKGMFGNHDYSKEELIAEMGACFFMADLGVEKHIENSAAYIQSWLKKLKGERKFLMQAAQQAEKSCDYVRGVSYDG